ncbi:hypothetical protein MKFW12EY_43960 (plasmid) [Methylomonas koyamae]|nr:hypothetical protein MKFW12EY_43960 [Methylomonas koyamae]
MGIKAGDTRGERVRQNHRRQRQIAGTRTDRLKIDGCQYRRRSNIQTSRKGGLGKTDRIRIDLAGYRPGVGAEKIAAGDGIRGNKPTIKIKIEFKAGQIADIRYQDVHAKGWIIRDDKILIDVASGNHVYRQFGGRGVESC